MSSKNSISYDQKAILSDSKNVLDNKIDKLKPMMTKLTSQNKNQANHLKIEISQRAEIDIENHHSEADLNVDKTSQHEISGGYREINKGFTGVEVSQETNNFTKHQEE